MIKIAKFLKQIRLDNEETLKDMAESLNVTPTFISAIEKGRKKMPVQISMEPFVPESVFRIL